MVGNKTPSTPVKRMNVLSEKEIQERLYGFYHQSDMVGEPKPKEPQPQEQVTVTQTVVTPPPLPPRFTPIANPIPQKPISIQRAGAESQKEILDVLKIRLAQATAYLKKIPTRVFGIAAAALVGLIIVSQLFAFGLKKIQEKKAAPSRLALSGSTALTTGRVQGPVHVESVKKSARKVAPEKAVAIPAAETPAELPPLNSTSVKLYTVQLALSDNVTASEGLIASLGAKGYEAYYRKVHGSRGNDLFQIFVGRYTSSSEAQSALKSLRSDDDFKNFDDSFVRVTQ